MFNIFKKKQHSKYIFTFGNVGAGKSTLLSAVTSFLYQKTALETNPDNFEGNKYLRSMWLKKLRNKEFPPQTQSGTLIEVDLGVVFENDESLQLTLLEMAGEDLKKIDRGEGDGKFEEKFVAQVNKANIFLIVTDVLQAEEDDYLIWDFLCEISRHRTELPPTALIITKWDLRNGSISLREFIEGKMNQTYRWLSSNKIENTSIFPFSIGKVNINANKIEEIDWTDTKTITTWISENLLN